MLPRGLLYLSLIQKIGQMISVKDAATVERYAFSGSPVSAIFLMPPFPTYIYEVCSCMRFSRSHIVVVAMDVERTESEKSKMWNGNMQRSQVIYIMEPT
jgi:hypothetical protein